MLLIEDDHCAGIAGASLHTLAGTTRHWAFVRSAAKAYGPDLRLALLAGDQRTVDRVQGRLRLGPGWISHLLQDLAVSLWRDKAAARTVHEAEISYTRSREALRAALADRGVTSHGKLRTQRVGTGARRNRGNHKAVERRVRRGAGSTVPDRHRARNADHHLRACGRRHRGAGRRDRRGRACGRSRQCVSPVTVNSMIGDRWNVTDTGMARWLTPLLSVGDLVMARRQLLNLKALAERPQLSTVGSSSTGGALPHPLTADLSGRFVTSRYGFNGQRRRGTGTDHLRSRCDRRCPRSAARYAVGLGGQHVSRRRRRATGDAGARQPGPDVPRSSPRSPIHQTKPGRSRRCDRCSGNGCASRPTKSPDGSSSPLGSGRAAR